LPVRLRQSYDGIAKLKDVDARILGIRRAVLETYFRTDASARRAVANLRLRGKLGVDGGGV
jgi:hypothetical protein